MWRPKLVATDLDGTLLDPRDRLTARTVAAVRNIVESGAHFVLVTGRPPRWIPDIAGRLGVSGMAVCANGAVLYDLDSGRVVEAELLQPDRIRVAAEVAAELLPGAALAVERVPGGRSPSSTTPFLAEPGFVAPWDNADLAVAPSAELLAEPVLKLLIRSEGCTSAAMAPMIAEALGPEFSVTISNPNGLLDVSAPGHDKATRLAEAAALVGVGREDVVAFGDMPNDVRMLEWAWHGVAMANAAPEVLAIADEVTASNAEDGVAAVLERWA